MFITYSRHAQFPFFKSCMFNILTLIPSITEFIQGNSNFFPIYFEINIRRKSVFLISEIIFRILESGFIFKFQVIIWSAAE